MEVVLKSQPSIEIGFESKGSTIEVTGTYPQMQVGKADDLSGHGESVPAEFTFRATGGKSIKDGTAYIKELQGNAVVWNQQASGETIVGDVARPLPQGAKLVAGHKYLILTDGVKMAQLYLYAFPQGGEGNYVAYVNEDSPSIIFDSSVSLESNGQYNAEGALWWYQYAFNDDAISNRPRVIDLSKMFGAGNEPTTIEEYESRKSIVADEYAYNEGEVIAFCGDAVKSVGDNAFNGVWYQGGVSDNDGSINTTQSYNLHTDTFRVIGGETYCSQFDGADLYLKGYFFDKSGAFIGSSDFDVWQGTKKWVAPINADSVRMRLYNGVGNITPSQAPNVMIRLDHSGWKSDIGVGYEPYWADILQIDSRIKAEFPNGMHKWDKVYNKDGKGYIVKGTGVVDLGDYDIIPSLCHNGEHRWLIGPLDSIKPIQGNSDKAGMISVFPLGSADSTYLSENGIGLDTERNIWLYDSRYTNRDDIDNVRQMLQGVMLYYELATPEILEFDTPFNFNYRVADFGTEELISEQPSAPFRARTIYQFNAVDQIRENAIKIQQLETMLATMQAQMANIINTNNQ